MLFGSSVCTQNPFLAPHRRISRLLFVKPSAGTSWMMAMIMRMLFSGYFSVSLNLHSSYRLLSVTWSRNSMVLVCMCKIWWETDYVYIHVPSFKCCLAVLEGVFFPMYYKQTSCLCHFLFILLGCDYYQMHMFQNSSYHSACFAYHVLCTSLVGCTQNCNSFAFRLHRLLF